jgi:hypothetical protein
MKALTVAVSVLCALALLSPHAIAAEGKTAKEPDGKTVRLPQGDGFAGWRQPAGDWQNVGGVAVDPKNPRRFVSAKGTGVLVNGARGRTRHLVTAAPHGDCEAHIEFVVPRGSNSGVYFMGRYEIQVLDSWGVKKPKHGDCGRVAGAGKVADLRHRLPGAPLRRRRQEDRQRLLRPRRPQRQDRARERGADRPDAGGHVPRREARRSDDVPGRPRPRRLPQHRHPPGT